MDNVFFIIAVVLIVMGFIEFVKFILEFVFNNKTTEEKIIIIPLKGEVEKLEFILRTIQTDVEWNENNSNIYLLDLGVEDEYKQIIEIFQNQNQYIKICNLDNLSEIISRNFCLQIADKYNII